MVLIKQKQGEYRIFCKHERLVDKKCNQQIIVVVTEI